MRHIQGKATAQAYLAHEASNPVGILRREETRWMQCSKCKGGETLYFDEHGTMERTSRFRQDMFGDILHIHKDEDGKESEHLCDPRRQG